MRRAHSCVLLSSSARALEVSKIYVISKQFFSGKGRNNNDLSNSVLNKFNRSKPIMNVGSGSSYYFPPEMVNKLPDFMQNRMFNENIVKIRGIIGFYNVNISKPPLTSEEMDRWTLDKILYEVPTHFFANKPKSVFLLSPTAMITSLGTRMEAVDRVYRQKGLCSPSEVAEVFFKITPTYYVEVRHVFQALSPELQQRFNTMIKERSSPRVFFERYPMLFKIHRSPFTRSAIKLNSDMEFIRAHPDYGKGDFIHRRHSSEYKHAVGGIITMKHPSVNQESEGNSLSLGRNNQEEKWYNIDNKIFTILLAHLPRIPDKAFDGDRKKVLEARYECIPLVPWINSFSKEELEVLNSVPQSRVIHIIKRYAHIFQLVTKNHEDVDVYTDCSLLIKEWRTANREKKASTTSEEAEGEEQIEEEEEEEKKEEQESCKGEAESDSCTQNKTGDRVIDKSNSSDVVSAEEEKESGVAAEVLPAAPPKTTGSSTTNTKCKIEDDLIGIDKLLSFDKTEADSTLTSNISIRQTEMGKENNTTNSVVNSENGSTEENNATVGKTCDDKTYNDNNDEDEEYFADNNDDNDNDNDNDNEGKKDDKCYDARDNEENEQGDDDSMSNADDANYLPTKYDVLFIRRMPPDVAPYSLSNFNEQNTPEPFIISHILNFLTPPPSLRKSKPVTFSWAKKAIKLNDCAISLEQVKVKQIPVGGLPPSPEDVWRWVPVQKIYNSLSRRDRIKMRRYRGFVNFLRLHGAILELSNDFSYLIAHDPKGRISPFRPTQKLFTIEERVFLPDNFDNDCTVSAVMVNENARKKFQGVLGNSQIPTSRKQIVLLDPDNALLNSYVLWEEISEYLPYRAIKTHDFMRQLPPLLRAGLAGHYDVKSSPFFIIFTEKGVSYIQRSELPPPKIREVAEISLDEAIEELLAVIPEGGATVRALIRHYLSEEANHTLRKHFDGIFSAAQSMPEFLDVKVAKNNINESMVYRKK